MFWGWFEEGFSKALAMAFSKAIHMVSSCLAVKLYTCAIHRGWALVHVTCRPLHPFRGTGVQTAPHSTSSLATIKSQSNSSRGKKNLTGGILQRTFFHCECLHTNFGGKGTRDLPNIWPTCFVWTHTTQDLIWQGPRYPLLSFCSNMWLLCPAIHFGELLSKDCV